MNTKKNLMVQVGAGLCVGSSKPVLPIRVESPLQFLSDPSQDLLVWTYMDLLVEVSVEYKLLSDTLYLAVSYIDRYLSMNAHNRQKLQLLGVSSMLIASKYEERKKKDGFKLLEHVGLEMDLPVFYPACKMSERAQQEAFDVSPLC